MIDDGFLLRWWSIGEEQKLWILVWKTALTSIDTASSSTYWILFRKLVFNVSLVESTLFLLSICQESPFKFNIVSWFWSYSHSNAMLLSELMWCSSEQRHREGEIATWVATGCSEWVKDDQTGYEEKPWSPGRQLNALGILTVSDRRNTSPT